jgi:hypothetical protein
MAYSALECRALVSKAEEEEKKKAGAVSTTPLARGSDAFLGSDVQILRR